MGWNPHGPQNYRKMDLLVNKFVLIGFAMNLVVGAACAVPATVTYIVDGDTFYANVMLDSDIRVRTSVRIIGIDTPEINGACKSEIDVAKRAKERLSKLLPLDSVVELTDIKDDKYLGRIDAVVKLSDGRDVGKILIKEKLARGYKGGKRKSWCSK